MSAHRSIVKGAAQALPLNLIAQAVPMLSRSELAALTERLIDALDALDPDPDFEDDDPLEEDDHAGTDLDAGELDVAERLPSGTYDIDQRIMLERHYGGIITRVNVEIPSRHT